MLFRSLSYIEVRVAAIEIDITEVHQSAPAGTELLRQIVDGMRPRIGRCKRQSAGVALIDLHIEDMKQVGKAPGRSKAATLDMLKRELGNGRAARGVREKAARSLATGQAVSAVESPVARAARSASDDIGCAFALPRLYCAPSLGFTRISVRV